MSGRSVGTILRELIAVEDQGGDVFFGGPALELADWFACDASGRGYVNILNAVKLIQSPQIYAMFLLWMMNELFETLPEAGDLEKPKFVFFFDEAHLLFKDMPGELLDKIIQVVKLIRSKGAGVYFITQGPSDIPDEVLAQLSNRIQHGLRAYMPAEHGAAAEEAKLTEERAKLEAEKVAFEKEKAAAEAKAAKEAEKAAERAAREAERKREREERAAEKRQEQMVRSVTRTAASILGSIGREASRQIVRGLFGSRRR